MGEKNGKSKLPEKSTDFVDDGVYRQTGVEKWVNTLLCRGDLAKESFQAKPVGVLDLFKYAEEHDRLLILIGLTSSIITGAVQALVAVMAGKLATALIESDQGKITKDEMWDRGFFMVKMNICVGVIVIATSLITNYCFKLAAKNIAAHLRSRFIKSILRQDAQWFDQQKFGALNTQLNDNISRIHDGIGDKVGLLIRCMCQLIVTLIVCFVIDWRITASMIVSAPLSCLIMSSMARMISSSTAKQLPLLDKSGAILQETIMNVKTVQSCNGQQEMIKKYHDSLLAARIHGILIGVWQGLFDGMFFVVIYVFFAIGLVYGGYLYYMDEIASGDVFIITTMLTMSVYFVGFISPHIMSVFKARVSAAIIYQQIERIPDIDCYNDYGEELPNCKGHIKFEDVKFAYPNRKDRQVLKGVTWEARPSETVALVGHSGCGKSTSISLLTRLYDVTAGKITIDGVDIRNLKITTLRQIIGIVQQEPVLFNGSIFENIKLGDDSITMDKAERACRMANAHDFIQKLEHGYNTNIGSGEIQLSGGQKQRIAIARAIVNNPPILLLDEATSALDAESEIHVQQALKHATQGRTTIVIAHRLSTLRDVQKIIVYDSGAVVEIGSHVELSEKEGGLYSSLVKHQQFKSVDKEQTNEEPMVMKRKETLRGSSLMSRDSVSVPDLGAEIAAEEPEYTDRKPRYGLLTLYKNCQGEYVKFITGAIFCCVRGMELVFYVVGLTLLFDAFRNKEVPWEQFAVGLELVGWFNVALGFYALIAILGSLAFLNWAGENVLIKLKVRALSTILSQGAAYFDRPQTSPPKLVQRITNDSLNCKAAMDIRLYHVLNNAFCTFMQFIVTFAMSWHIGVVGTILYIAILAVLGCMARMMQDGIRAVQKRDDSPKLAVEIIENTKTIQLLTREKYFAEKYDQSLEAPESEEKKVIWADSVTFSITQSAMYLSDVICYSCALWMIYYWDADVTRMFMACNTMSTMSWSILFISISLVEMMHAAPATNSLFSIFGEDLCVDANEEYGETPKVMGNVVAEKVFFSYPTRPDITVTNGLNVKALAGETIALVGPSGGGKSTIINLLQRFYEPKSGNVSVDGNAINSFKLSYLRSEMALVGQEPVLFSGTIYENATLGMEDVDPHWVMEAFELANAKKFIENLPEGYDTEVGEKGAQLSGGQKQRVAIARALVRRPKILLLDEATSALDAESERAVQQALDTAASGRTCITIAHRLSSIQHADKIYFISNGRVTEVGTHAELMNADGAYADMIRKQDLQSTAEN